jgi:hypothetical protein
MSEAMAKGSPQVEHPSWCDISTCAVNVGNRFGDHVSRMTTLEPMTPSPLAAAVWLTQGPEIDGYPWTGTPLITMTLTAGRRGLGFVVMHPAMAERLGRLLLHYPTVARGDTRIPTPRFPARRAI